MFHSFNANGNQKLSKFVPGFVYNGGKYYFKLSCTMSLFLIKEVFLCFNCIFVLPWKYNMKRNANLDFSIVELQLLFELGVKKISMQKILIAKRFMILFLYKNCAWLQQFHI